MGEDAGAGRVEPIEHLFRTDGFFRCAGAQEGFAALLLLLSTTHMPVYTGRRRRPARPCTPTLVKKQLKTVWVMCA